MIIPDDRVKTITASRQGYREVEEQLVEMVLHEIARGIIDKLREFNKVRIIEIGEDHLHVTCTLQIIVPPRVNQRSGHTIPPVT